MFCKHCGKQLNINENFCKYCGQAVVKNDSLKLGQSVAHVEKNQSLDPDKNINKKTVSYLNSKVWYRFLKVAYIIAFIAVIIPIVREINMSYAPKELIDNDSSYIYCDDGKEFKINETDVFLSSEIINHSEDEKFKNKCYSVSSLGTPQERITRLRTLVNTSAPIEKNYKLVIKYKTIGSWTEVISNLFVVLIVIGIIFEIIKNPFYYLALGTINPK